MSRKGQITIFIILAIIIVSAIILFFLFRGNIIPGIGGKAIKNPNEFLRTCIKDKVEESLELISSQGGYTNPVLMEEFDGKKISYLCYTQNFYLPCINQEPMLMNHLKDEIHDYIEEDFDLCFSQLEEGLKQQGYSVDLTYRGFLVELIPGKVLINTDSKIVLEKNEEVSTQENFEFVVASKFYDLASVAQEITSQEARFCNFDIQGFMLFYQDYDIDKFKTGSSITVYTIKHKTSEEEFKFLVRSCVIPPGF